MIPFQPNIIRRGRSIPDQDGKCWAWWDFVDNKLVAYGASNYIYWVKDKSDHGNDLHTQYGSSGNRPTYSADGIFSAIGLEKTAQTKLSKLGYPVTVYAVIKQPIWASGQYLIDGKTAGSISIRQAGTTPTIAVLGSGIGNPDLVLDTWGILVARMALDGRISTIQINRESVITSALTYSNPLPKGVDFVGSSRFYVREMIIRTEYDIAETIQSIYTYLADKHDPTGSLGLQYFTMDSSEVISDSWSFDDYKLPH